MYCIIIGSIKGVDHLWVRGGVGGGLRVLVINLALYFWSNGHKIRIYGNSRDTRPERDYWTTTTTVRDKCILRSKDSHTLPHTDNQHHQRERGHTLWKHTPPIHLDNTLHSILVIRPYLDWGARKHLQSRGVTTQDWKAPRKGSLILL